MTKFNVGDKVAGGERAFAHHIGDTGVITVVDTGYFTRLMEEQAYWVDWDRQNVLGKGPEEKGGSHLVLQSEIVLA